MSLFDRLHKVAKKNNEYANPLDESEVMNYGVLCKTPVPMFNVALSGSVDGGMYSGITQLVGDSRTFKTCYALLMMAAYMQEHPDSVALFFDSERGAAFEYFDSFDIDKHRVLHLPIRTVEDLTIQMTQQVNEIKKGDKVFLFVDSIGLLPSNKEAKDAQEGKDTQDMTRARAMNSFFRIVTNPVGLRDLPLVVINHYYNQLTNAYAEAVIKGGKNATLASNDIWMVTRSRVKDKNKEQIGWSFNIRIVKSRRVKEGAIIPITVTYGNGIDPSSGLLEVARATGHIKMISRGKYARTFIENDEPREKEAMDWDTFWKPLVEDGGFQKSVKELYSLSSGQMFNESIVEKMLEEYEADE